MENPTSERRKGPIFNSACELGRSLMVAGVPGRYWKIRRKDVGEPVSILYNRPWYKEGKAYQVTPAQQQQWIDDILDGHALKESAPLVAVGSEPSEDMGLLFGVAVIERALKLELKVRMISAHRIPREVEGNIPDVCVLYNIAANASPFRLDVCREWIAELDDVFLVMIVSGTDPASFFLDTLNQSFDQALYFKGQYHGEVGERRV
jgi:hypothetical protein